MPQKLSVDEKTMSDSYAKFVAEPYERGYGHTVGNALRRVLLSSLEGAAVTAVRIEKATHEYQALPGVKEDVMNVLLNLKKLRVKLFSNGPETVFLAVNKEGVVTAKNISGNANVEVVNKDLVIAHLEAGGKIDMEIEISKGRGYVPAEELRAQNQWAAGFLPVDALFSPVVKVHYDVENARVGQVTDYDRLILEIWTDGSLNPAEALIQSSKLLRESLNIFIPEEEQQAEAATAGFEAAGEEGASDIAIAGLDPKLREILNQPIEMIELSSRASNCLKVAHIRTIGELVGKRDEELLAVKNFGRKSLDEIKDRLKDMGLSLGMQVGQVA
ncbi:MAG: DNA-directed RNA polymerase subunit alpha [Elusimicrobia bacterium GWC2_65_9]|nr:MAG: DNA-directed RNA polymerase subunit alpha [Elusimicrobia bacterium GWA2_66_18]OGR73877.1 MAG: DNA-directed RNA polymerase subunit alpha [Elusimicrobia bacterium GWC2_65_9]